MKPGNPVAAVVFLLLASPLWAVQAEQGANLGKVTGGDFSNVNALIDQKCTKCHGAGKIETAMKSGKDMATIQKEMEQKGAKLTPKEREVLGIYWNQNPLKQKK